MIIGILKEIKPEESRVAMTPAGVELMSRRGHTVLVEKSAGVGSGFDDLAYAGCGAVTVDAAEEIFSRSDMVMHVKEPQPSEYHLIRKGQIVFCYLHLAADEALTTALVESQSIAIAYETVQKKDGSLPLLVPMSEIAGRMAVQEGAKYLERPFGGRGVLLSGATGVMPGRVLILGGGVVGMNAAKMACGMGAVVYVLDKNLGRLNYLSTVMPKNCFPLMSDPVILRKLVAEADLVVGAVLIPGGSAPRLVTRELLGTMKKGAVIVDVAVDQGGCFETSRPTTHLDPVYAEQGIVHYCVSNMPGAVPVTSTRALTNATLPYALKIADQGWVDAARHSEEIRWGVNVAGGHVIHPHVAEAFGLQPTDLKSISH